MNAGAAIVSVSVVSLLSLLGVALISMKKKTLERIITYTLAFSSGVLLSSALLELMPESVARIGNAAFTWVLVGLVSFFCLEKLIHWHHHVEGDEDEPEKPFAYLTLIGDGIHNFTDGAVIAAAFMVSFPLGVTTTLAIIAHEIPHELSDFLILLHGGFTHKRALWFNFLSATTAIAGTLSVLLVSSRFQTLTDYMVPFAAGNFLYIASTDLIPELLKKRQGYTSFLQVLLLVSGAVLLTILEKWLGSA
jgi:zinc and cadmium transporter